MLVLYDSQQVLIIRLSYEAEGLCFKLLCNFFEKLYRRLWSEGLFENFLCIFNAALGNYLLRQAYLVEIVKHLAYGFYRPVIHLSYFKSKFLYLVIGEELEYLRSIFRTDSGNNHSCLLHHRKLACSRCLLCHYISYPFCLSLRLVALHPCTDKLSHDFGIGF